MLGTVPHTRMLTITANIYHLTKVLAKTVRPKKKKKKAFKLERKQLNYLSPVTDDIILLFRKSKESTEWLLKVNE